MKTLLIIKILLLLITFYLCNVVSHAQTADPLPLGKFLSTSAEPDKCPPGFSCSGFVVNCAGMESARGFLAIASHHQSNTRGLVIFFTGGPGTSWFSREKIPEIAMFTADLLSHGFIIAQVKWEDSWLHSSPGNDAGIAHLASRPATVIKHVYEKYYLPLGITTSGVGEAGFCITGNSGGASQVSYALSHYGLENILDVVIPTGGPPHSVLAKSLLKRPGEEAYWYEKASTSAFIDKGFGFFDDDGPGVRKDTTFIQRWMEEGVATGGNDYHHPETRIHFIIGEDDHQMKAMSKDYSDRLKREGSPFVTVEIAPNTGHGMMGSPVGRAALRSAIIGKKEK